MKQMAVTDNLTSAAVREIDQDNVHSIHPTCVLDPSVQFGKNVTIHANVVVERGVKIGNGVVLHASCYIGEDCSVGDDTVLGQSVVLREKTQVGSNVVIESGVIIGSDGFGYAKEANGVNCKVPQVGSVIIEDNVRIGANTTIDRATLGKTVIGNGVKIGNLVQVGHNVELGVNTEVGDSVGICGSCKIGTDVSIGHGVGMVGHIKIGDGSQVKSGAGVSKDVSEHAEIMGSPAMNKEQYDFFQGCLTQLPDFLSRLNALEEKYK